MDTAEHVERLVGEANSFASALADLSVEDLGATVVTCSDWTLRQLVEHVGGIYRWCTRLVADSIVVETWRREMDLAYPTGDGEVVAWYADSIGPMIDAFSTAPADRRVWVWGADPHARFWSRRMLHETAVHRADLLWSIGHEPVIETAVAVDGIDEFLTNLPCTARWGAPVDRLRGDGETMVVRASDTEDSWRTRFDPTGLWWDRGGEPGDAVVTGTAADLYLMLQGRKRPSVTVTGRDDLVQRWRDALAF
jgi:uncharacterized protein (TIGR03083 family)